MIILVIKILLIIKNDNYESLYFRITNNSGILKIYQILIFGPEKYASQGGLFNMIKINVVNFDIYTDTMSLAHF